MAFMAMRKNLDDRHRKKNFDEIFKKFDHNHNQRVSIREFTEVLNFVGQLMIIMIIMTMAITV